MSEQHLGFTTPDALMRNIRQTVQSASLSGSCATMFLFLCEFPCRDQAGYFLNDPVTAELDCESEVTQQSPQVWLCSMARLLTPDMTDTAAFCETLVEQVLLYRGRLVASEVASSGDEFHILEQKHDVADSVVNQLFRVTTPARFPHLDATFYQELMLEFRALGFLHIADLEEERLTGQTDLHTFTRYLLHPQTSTVAKGTLLPESAIRITELESLMSDGTVICTTTDGASDDSGGSVSLLVNPVAEGLFPEEVLRLHLQKVEDYSAAKPFVSVREVRSLDDVIDLQQTIAQLQLETREQSAWL
ncbi:hypothetical protein [Alteromonas sp. H39]|uniref:hypothetical protein n=1 Tax=Alteromonas sp. H39 TaxID=3389876 RepID=UPI0039E16B2E